MWDDFSARGTLSIMGQNEEGHFVKIEQRGRERINTIIQDIKTSHICCDDTLILMASCVFLV
jgi:hypothetical protein